MTRWLELVRLMRQAEIPAPKLRAVVLAQWALESGHGASDLSKIHNNYSGLKWREEMGIIANKVRYGAHDGFDYYCSFSSIEQFINGYWLFIGRDVYQGWQDYGSDPVGYISFLKARGFAGDPNYVEKVINLLPEAESMLAEANDIYEQFSEDDRPDRSSYGDSFGPLGSKLGEPEFVTLSSVVHKFVGDRPNGVEGMIVHYDAGRNQSKKDPMDLEWGAKNCLESGENNEYAYITVSRSGKLYLPNNFSWEKWGSHAGKSLCPKTQRESVSRYYVGFEVNCPGLVYQTADNDKFVPWFNSVMKKVKNKQGKWIDVIDLDSKGHAKIRDLRDVVYTKAELRYVKNKDENVAPGYYVPYTEAQFNALVKVAVYLKRKYTNTFRLDYIFGHDEVAPNRKVDPGASLGLAPDKPHFTMEGFRKHLFSEWANELT
jgi:hypothetical protein